MKSKICLAKKSIDKLLEQYTDATKRGCFRNQIPIHKIASFLQKSRQKDKKSFTERREIYEL